jgi:3-dehydroquinate dehydratase/shikimate dehydrogenase
MPSPLLCVTVTATTTAELRRRRDDAGGDLVELRLDSIADAADVDVAGALAGRHRPVIVTCRPEWEGGRFRGSEAERKRVLAEALALGADYVDVEWRAGFDDLIKAGGRRIVLSMHDFEGVPADLEARARAMRAQPVGVVKIAVAAADLRDSLPLLTLARSWRGEPEAVLIAMGEAGLVTRVLASRFGSKWVYAGSDLSDTVGQVSTATLLNEYRFRSLGESTEVYGVVGNPVGHSVSPAMHNAAFAAMGRNAVYLPFRAATADDFVELARALDVRGASITTPHKVAMLDHVSDVSAVARQIGAINTVRVVDGRWWGDNTDAAGFLAPLANRLNLSGLRAALLGAGGAARAVAAALGGGGARVSVHARNREKAERVAALASGEVGASLPPAGSWDLLVNCTPIGMYPRVNETPLRASELTGQWVYDVIYNPQDTALLVEARRAGCRTIGGLDMLVAQAQEQLRWWTGVRPDAAIMREAATRRLLECARDEHHVV